MARAKAKSGLQIGFAGAGRMATALAQGLIRAEFAAARQIVASDVSAAARKQFADQTGAVAVESNAELLSCANVVVLAVKPQHMAAVLADLQSQVTPDHLIVSIAAGITLRTLAASLGDRTRLVRVMPNTPCLVQRGASAFAIGGAATAADADLVERLLSTVGIAFQVPEHLLDAVTGLSGSGPAYVCEMIEALSDGGVRVGLPRDVAAKLAAQTVLGTAEMVLATGEHPAVLKDAVASPGGTTIAGLHELERGGLRAALMNAVVSATQRSQELGRQ